MVMLILHEIFGSPNNLNMEALSFMIDSQQIIKLWYVYTEFYVWWRFTMVTSVTCSCCLHCVSLATHCTLRSPECESRGRERHQHSEIHVATCRVPVAFSSLHVSPEPML